MVSGLPAFECAAPVVTGKRFAEVRLPNLVGGQYWANSTNRALEVGEEADLYILCRSKEIAAHRAVLFSASGSLKKLCKMKTSRYRVRTH
jgi:hypothetical protein